MDLTIVICTHNRAHLLKKTLGSINQTKRPSGCKVEILVVANACTDDTIEIFNSYNAKVSKKDWLPLRWIEEPIPGKSRSLNHAISEITSPVIAFVDDDQKVGLQWLLAVWHAVVENPKVTCFCGRMLPDWNGTEPSWVHDNGIYRIRPLPTPYFDMGDTPLNLTIDTHLPPGGCLFLRRSVFLQTGLFSLNMGPQGHNLAGGEDVDFMIRALKNGNRLLYIPNAIQYHYVDPARLTIWYLCKKTYCRSRDLMQIKAPPSGKKVGGIPVYLFRKVLSRLLKVVSTFNQGKRRYYLVRLATTLGEIEGFWKSMKNMQKQLYTHEKVKNSL